MAECFCLNFAGFDFLSTKSSDESGVTKGFKEKMGDIGVALCNLIGQIIEFRTKGPDDPDGKGHKRKTHQGHFPVKTEKNGGRDNAG